MYYDYNNTIHPIVKQGENLLNVSPLRILRNLPHPPHPITPITMTVRYQYILFLITNMDVR